MNKLSPALLIKAACALGEPWAVWREDHAERARIVVCVGGEPLPWEAERRALSEPVEVVASPMGQVLARPQLARLAPQELFALRFDHERSWEQAQSLEGESPWRESPWGARGWRWRPHLSLNFWLELKGDDRAQDESPQLSALEVPCEWAGALWRDAALWAQRLSTLSSSAVSAQLMSAHSNNTTEPTPIEATPIETARALEREGEEAWTARVELALKRLSSERDPLNKVVLARESALELPEGQRWSALETFKRCFELSTPNAIPYALCLSPRCALVGLTPERLAVIEGERLSTHALAGTRDSSRDPERRQAMINDLLSARKDAHEHELVVEELCERLAPFCERVERAPRRVRELPTLLHLETPLEGQLKAHVDPLELIQALHPTPALGGSPRRDALAALRADEPLERGGYAAPWGWRNLNGDLSAYVVIRSALLCGRRAHLFAGAGVVEGSVPELEWRETNSKLNAMRSLLAVEPAPTQAQHTLNASLALLEALLKGGLAGVVISPGSRSTPLALAAEALAPCALLIDERQAAFYALGWARAAGAPVALICTSGSAGAHYLPALIEARMSGASLIALTADRPAHIRGLGAPQTIDQRGLFGAYVGYHAELSAPRADVSAPERWRAVAQEALEVALTHPLSSVHLNLCLEEPLWSPELEPALALRRALHATARAHLSLMPLELRHARRALSPVNPSALSSALLSAQRGLIYCGPLNAHTAARLAEPLAALAQALKWPVCLEAASQLRSHPALEGVRVCWLEGALKSERSPQAREMIGDLEAMLFVGAAPHARVVQREFAAWGAKERERLGLAPLEWQLPLERARCVLLGERPEPANPSRLPSAWAQGEPEALLKGWLNTLNTQERHLSERSEAHMSAWRDLDQRFEPQLKSHLKPHMITRSPLWGGAVGLTISEALQRRAERGLPKAHLHVASSMAFRDLDMTLSPQAPCALYTQRGANGIDGTLTSALGALRALPLDAPALTWIGDTAAHHDLAALARWGADPLFEVRRAPSVILLVNNGGGGIFGLLPIKGSESFERLFFTPISEHQRASWRELSVSFGLEYERFERLEPLSVALQALLCSPNSTSEPQRPRLWELVIDPEEDLSERARFWSERPWCADAHREEGRDEQA